MHHVGLMTTERQVVWKVPLSTFLFYHETQNSLRQMTFKRHNSRGGGFSKCKGHLMHGWLKILTRVEEQESNDESTWRLLNTYHSVKKYYRFLLFLPLSHISVFSVFRHFKVRWVNTKCSFQIRTLVIAEKSHSFICEKDLIRWPLGIRDR